MPKFLKSTSVDWQALVNWSRHGVVELRVNLVQPFVDGTPGSRVATGLVVDKKRGLILTNRHVVTLGPITANAVFSNKKTVDVTPVYRDPVHDFGFFKYNPQDLDYPEIAEFKLAPDVIFTLLYILIVIFMLIT